MVTEREEELGAQQRSHTNEERPVAVGRGRGVGAADSPLLDEAVGGLRAAIAGTSPGCPKEGCTRRVPQRTVGVAVMSLVH